MTNRACLHCKRDTSQTAKLVDGEPGVVRWFCEKGHIAWVSYRQVFVPKVSAKRNYVTQLHH
jgi:hypothetical protein